MKDILFNLKSQIIVVILHLLCHFRSVLVNFNFDLRRDLNFLLIVIVIGVTQELGIRHHKILAQIFCTG